MTGTRKRERAGCERPLPGAALYKVIALREASGTIMERTAGDAQIKPYQDAGLQVMRAQNG